MENVLDMFDSAIEHWRTNKGIGSALIPAPLDDRIMVLGILQNLYNKNPSCEVLIIVPSFQYRAYISEFITTQNDENDKEFKELLNTKRIKIYTESFVEKINRICPFVTIWYRPCTYSDSTFNIFSSSKFRLCVTDKYINDAILRNNIYKCCPLLNEFKQNDIDAARMGSPVEETLIGISIPEDEEQNKLLKYYNKYIEISLNIFGSLEQMDKARNGDYATNQSAINICYQIAVNNGWRDKLDMSYEYNRQLDELYNPNRLFDRAKETYNTIRQRANLLSDYYGKLEEILNIVQENNEDDILIINKRGEFASSVTNYINNNSESTICGNYHDKVEPIPAVDINGKPLFYKSGPKAGERREMAAQAQKTLNETLFNKGVLRVLSTSAAPDKSLKARFTTVIITSPQCEEIENYLYRMANIIVARPLKVYTLYVRNSLEERQIEQKTETETHKIVKKCENRVVNENNSDFVIVD